LREDVAMTGQEFKPSVRWWKGARGEWYVVVQVLLLLLVAFGPRTFVCLPAWTGRFAEAARIAGIVLMVAGGGFFLTALARLGKNLTPLPYPKVDGQLVQSGVYGLVRHPIYCGGIVLALGWALTVRGPATVGYAVLLLLFFDVKSRREERWLVTKFPAYAAYQKRVRKLIPYVY